MYKENPEQKRLRQLRNADYKRRVLARYKRQKGCIDCGYKINSDALEFDHKPGTKGRNTVASTLYNSWKVIKAEIAKCEIRCANCHAIKTFERKRAAGENGRHVCLRNTSFGV